MAALGVAVAVLLGACSTSPAGLSVAEGTATPPPALGSIASRTGPTVHSTASPAIRRPSTSPAPTRTTPSATPTRTPPSARPPSSTPSTSTRPSSTPAGSTAAGNTTPGRPTGPPAPPPGGAAAAAAADLGGDLGLAGLNDATCRSDSPPVVLLQGTLSTVTSNFATLVPELRAAGFCPFARPYRFGGTVPVRETAGEQTDFVGRVLAATGASRVDLVGYSQGALVARTALRDGGIAGQVRVLVLVAGTYHGTTAALLERVPAAVCAGCVDQRAGSGLLQALDAGGELDGDVRYAAVSSRADRVVTPVERQTPTGPADRVTWTVLQDRCPTSTTPHESMLADPSVRRWVVSALTSGGRPDAATLSC